jgi:hypothetical protein
MSKEKRGRRKKGKKKRKKVADTKSTNTSSTDSSSSSSTSDRPSKEDSDSSRTRKDRKKRKRKSRRSKKMAERKHAAEQHSGHEGSAVHRQFDGQGRGGRMIEYRTPRPEQLDGRWRDRIKYRSDYEGHGGQEGRDGQKEHRMKGDGLDKQEGKRMGSMGGDTDVGGDKEEGELQEDGRTGSGSMQPTDPRKQVMGLAPVNAPDTKPLFREKQGGGQTPQTPTDTQVHGRVGAGENTTHPYMQAPFGERQLLQNMHPQLQGDVMPYGVSPHAFPNMGMPGMMGMGMQGGVGYNMNMMQMGQGHGGPYQRGFYLGMGMMGIHTHNIGMQRMQGGGMGMGSGMGHM